MEFLLVRFEESREVRVDGNPYGRTNIVLQVEAGEHRITLAPPRNFSPIEQVVLLANTAAVDPCRLTFEKLPPAAVPVSPGSGV